jgi:hypothetical protein
MIHEAAEFVGLVIKDAIADIRPRHTGRRVFAS